MGDAMDYDYYDYTPRLVYGLLFWHFGVSVLIWMDGTRHGKLSDGVKTVLLIGSKSNRRKQIYY